MTGRARIILAAVVSVVVLIAFFFIFVRSRQDELGDVNDQVEAEEARTATLTSELQRLQELEANAPELRAELEEIRQFVPQNNQVPNFIFLVQEAANQSGVGFLQITPELPDLPLEGASLAEVRVQIRAKGGFFSVQDFIRRLYNLDRALRMDVLSITGTEDPEEAEREGRTELLATARIFFELPPGAGPGAAPTAPPAGVPTPTPSPTPEPTETPGA